MHLHHLQAAAIWIFIVPRTLLQSSRTQAWPPRLTQQADGGDDDELLLRRQLLDGQHVHASAARTTGQRRNRICHVPDAHKRRSWRCDTQISGCRRHKVTCSAKLCRARQVIIDASLCLCQPGQI